MTVVAIPHFLAAEVARLDALITRAVLAMRMRRALTQEEFCGLRVSDAQIDAALTGQGRPPPGSVNEPRAPLPGTGPPSRWVDLVRRLDLSVAEQDVLLLAALPQIDRRYEAIFAHLNDRMCATAPTVDVMLRVFEGLPGIADALSHGSRLLASGAVSLSEEPEITWRARAVQATDPVALWLFGVGYRAADSWLVPMPEANMSPEPRKNTTGMVVHVTGPIGELRRKAAAERLAQQGWRAVELQTDGSAVPPPRRLRQLGLACTLWDLAPVVPSDRPELTVALLRNFPAHQPLALLGGRVPADPDRPVLHVASGRIAPETSAALWRETAGCSDDLAARLAESFEMGPRKVARIVESARLSGGGEARILAAARAACAADFGPLARPVSTAAADTLILPAPTARAVDEFGAAIRQRRRVLLDWGFGPDRGCGALSALFTGPPGTGKTHAAAALARETGLNLYRIDLSAVVDKYIGETEKNLERIFDAATGNEAMLLFDEADALFGKRAETRDARDRYANLEVSYLLQRIEALPPEVVVVLTTNLAKNMDQAFARRLSHMIDFPRPTAALRRRLWAAVFPKRAPVMEGLDLDLVADTFDLSGGEIRQVALDAAFRAATAGRAIGMREIVAALRSHFDKLGRAVPDSAYERLSVGRAAPMRLPAAE